MSTLASWIDSDAVASMARDLCPVEDEPEGVVGGVVSGVWLGGNGAPRREVADFPGEEEVSRARAKLESIRAQARHSGLIDHAVEVVVSEVPGRIAPVPERADEEDAAPMESAETGRERAGVIGEVKAVGGGAGGDGPFQETRPVGKVIGAPVGEPAEDVLPSYVIPHGTLGVRMGCYAAWVSEVTGGADVFVIDSQGYPLVERGGDADLVAAALLLGDASRRASGQVDGGDGVVRMEVGGGMVLSVLACETQYGTLCVCVHGRIAVRRATAARLSAALRVTLGV